MSESEDGFVPAPGLLSENEGAPAATAAEEPAWGACPGPPSPPLFDRGGPHLLHLCTMCQGAHRTMDCPTPRCWVCHTQQAPYHWPKSCPNSASCELCCSRHNKFFCPMNPDRPCARCSKWGHIAPVCSATATLSCDLCQPPDHTIAECLIPRCLRCLSPEHLESGCPSERHMTGSCPPVMCFNCHQLGHSSWECSREVVCNKCGETGHYKQNCPNPAVREMCRCRACGQGGHIQRDCHRYLAPSGLSGVIAAASRLFNFSVSGIRCPRAESPGPGRIRSRFDVTDDR